MRKRQDSASTISSITMFIYQSLLSFLFLSMCANPIAISSAHKIHSKIINVLSSATTIHGNINTRINKNAESNSTQPSVSPVPPNTTSPTITPTVSPTPNVTAEPTTISPNTTSPTLSPTTSFPTTISPYTTAPTTSSPNTTAPTLSPTPNSTTNFPTVAPTLGPDDDGSFTVSQVFSFMVISGILVFTFFMLIKFRVHVYFFLRETMFRCGIFCGRICTGTRSTNRYTEASAPLNEVIFDPTDGSNTMRQPLITSNMSLGGSEQL